MEKGISRRDFLETCLSGAGLVLAVSITPFGCRVMPARQAPPLAEGVLSPAVWLRVTPRNEVVVIVNKSEMGQGVYTALPMILAEELEADWRQVRFEVAPAGKPYVDPIWKMQITGGSTSVRHMFEPLRVAGATARDMLVRAAAETWKVAPDACETHEGRVTHTPSGRSLSYGELSRTAATMPVPTDPPLKKPAQFRILGRAIPRLDMADKVNGSAEFGIDTVVPGMLYAALARPPAYGAKALSYDAEAARRVAGVRHIVAMKQGVAVCGDSLEAAMAGRRALEVKWSPGSHPDLGNASLERDFLREVQRPGHLARDDGNVEGAMHAAVKRITAIYVLPYLAHATMEPMNCTARVTADRCDVWVPTQNQTAVLRVASKATGLGADRIHVHTTYLGGGFGRRFETDVVEEAVVLAKETGRPAKVIWTREEDMQNDFYRPASCSILEGGLDAQGRPTAWSHTIAVPSIFARVMPWWLRKKIDPAAVEGAQDMPYAIPNVQVRYVRVDTPVPVGFWRSVGHSHNAFTVETFMDELAQAAGRDPLDYRLALLENRPRERRVLELAAEKAGWGKPLMGGAARGLALHCSFGTHVAQVAEISVDRQVGNIKVHRIVCAVDCGLVINPDILEAQMESAVNFGLSAALKERVVLARGGVQTRNFDDYEILRMSEAPIIEVHIVTSEEPPGGIGEPGVPPVAPALGNALFAATGARLRRLPMNPEALKGIFSKHPG